MGQCAGMSPERSLELAGQVGAPKGPLTTKKHAWNCGHHATNALR
jgi:hypothetical protein